MIARWATDTMLPAGSKLVLEFKAGKMEFSNGKTLKPDARKGTVRVLRVRIPGAACTSCRASRALCCFSWAIAHLLHLPPPRAQTEDGLTHLMWHERTDAGTKADPEDDVVVFPEEAKFEKVGPACKRWARRVLGLPCALSRLRSSPLNRRWDGASCPLGALRTAMPRP